MLHYVYNSLDGLCVQKHYARSQGFDLWAGASGGHLPMTFPLRLSSKSLTIFIGAQHHSEIELGAIWQVWKPFVVEIDLAWKRRSYKVKVASAANFVPWRYIGMTHALRNCEHWRGAEDQIGVSHLA